MHRAMHALSGWVHLKCMLLAAPFEQKCSTVECNCSATKHMCTPTALLHICKCTDSSHYVRLLFYWNMPL